MASPTNVLTGSVFPDPAKQQPYEYGRREHGRYASVPYESVSQSQIDALATQADLLGLNYRTSLTFGKARIVIEYPYNFINTSFPGSTTESTSIWEIIPAQSSKDLLDSTCPLVLAVLANDTYGQQEVQLLKAWQRQNQLETNLTNQTPGASFGAFVQPTIASGTNFGSYGTLLAKFIYDGVSTVEVPQPVLTHTTTTTLNYINPSTFIDVGYIFSNATLIATENIPSAVLFDFPSNSDPAGIPVAGAVTQYLLYGWLKGAPSIRQAGNNKWNITQSYTYGLWGIALYGNGTRL